MNAILDDDPFYDCQRVKNLILAGAQSMLNFAGIVARLAEKRLKEKSLCHPLMSQG